MVLGLNNCPCGSGMSYKKCCYPFHKNKAKPKNALLLMRSRYCAYVLGKARYIIKTTHPKNPEYATLSEVSIKEFCKSDFKKLEIVEFIDGDEEAFVEFKAYIGDYVLHEKSRFVRQNGEWKYRDGEIYEF